MKTIIAAILLFSSGYFTGNYLFSRTFDPDRFLQEAFFLAGKSYLNGCLEAKSDPKECHRKATQLYLKLEELRNQNP